VSKESKGINYETLIKHALQARPDASVEDIRRIAPQLNALHFNDLSARITRIRNAIKKEPDRLPER
jgi:hypothetical protein